MFLLCLTKSRCFGCALLHLLFLEVVPEGKSLGLIPGVSIMSPTSVPVASDWTTWALGGLDKTVGRGLFVKDITFAVVTVGVEILLPGQNEMRRSTYDHRNNL